MRRGLHSHLWPVIAVALLSGGGEQKDAHSDETTAAATVEIRLSNDRQAIRSIGYGWTFDRHFSAEMLESFDEDANGSLDAKADGLPARCTAQIVQPNFDEIVAKDPQALNDDPAKDPDGFKTISLFATRLTITCA